MTRYHGEADEVALGEQADIDTVAAAYGLEAYLDVQKCTWKIDNKTTPEYSADATMTPESHVDKIVWVEGTLTARLVNPLIFDVFLGASTDVTPDFTATLATALQYHSLKMPITAAKHALIKGAKFNGFKLTMEDRESPILIESDYFAKHYDVVSSTMTALSPERAEIMAYETHVHWDGANIGIVNKMTAFVDFGLNPERGIEDIADRQISEVLEYDVEITGTMEIVVEDSTIVELLLGGTGITSARSEGTLELKVSSTNNRVFDFDFTSAILKAGDGDVRSEGGERVIPVDFSARGIAVAGTYEPAP